MARSTVVENAVGRPISVGKARTAPYGPNLAAGLLQNRLPRRLL